MKNDRNVGNYIFSFSYYPVPFFDFFSLSLSLSLSPSPSLSLSPPSPSPSSPPLSLSLSLSPSLSLSLPLTSPSPPPLSLSLPPSLPPSILPPLFLSSSLSRKAMEKMHTVYTDNPKLGDAQAVTQSLEQSELNIQKLNTEKEKFQVRIAEQTIFCGVGCWYS